MSIRSSHIKRRLRRQTADAKSLTEHDQDDNRRLAIYLERNCREYGCETVPELRDFFLKDGKTVFLDQLCQAPEPPKEVDESIVPLPKGGPVITNYYDSYITLQKVVCKGPQLRRPYLLALLKTLSHADFYCELNCLKLEFCNLTSDDIEILNEAFVSKKILNELSLNGNPNDQQNFNILLSNSNLMSLSLKLCGLNKIGLKKIADEFSNGNVDPTFCCLDLSSNMIFDENCCYIAQILRCDRKLIYLNIADCKISDEGCKEIMQSFQKFPLNKEEIYIKRKLKFEYYRTLEKIKNQQLDERFGENEIKELIDYNEKKLKSHPFTAQSTEENGEIFCKGNYTLEYLNMSYNHLTKLSLDLILKTIMEQSIAFGTNKGLVKVSLQGNKYQNSQDDLNAIEEMLNSKKCRLSSGSTRSRSSIIRRKSGGSKSSGVGSKSGSVSKNSKDMSVVV